MWEFRRCRNRCPFTDAILARRIQTAPFSWARKVTLFYRIPGTEGGGHTTSINADTRATPLDYFRRDLNQRSATRELRGAVGVGIDSMAYLGQVSLFRH